MSERNRSVNIDVANLVVFCGKCDNWNDGKRGCRQGGRSVSVTAATNGSCTKASVEGIKGTMTMQGFVPLAEIK